MRVVLCNCPPEVALPLARALVDERLAASVNVIPGVISVYRWQGEHCETPEHALIVKAPAERLSALRDRIRQLHPYDTPEITVLPVQRDETDARFLAWVRESVTAG